MDSVYELGSSIDLAGCWAGGLDKGDVGEGAAAAGGLDNKEALGGGEDMEDGDIGGGGGGTTGEDRPGEAGPLPKAFLAACSAKEGL